MRAGTSRSDRGSSDLGPRAAIVGLSTAAACLYGVLHDQVTVRICLEYFTVFHPAILSTEDPTALALFWGVFATWWAGAGIGVLLAPAARAGGRPRVPVRDLLLPLEILLLSMAATAAAAGIVGRVLALSGLVRIVPAELAAAIPAEEHVDFLTCLWIHNGSYAAGFLGGIILAWRTWRRRGEPAGSPEERR